MKRTAITRTVPMRHGRRRSRYARRPRDVDFMLFVKTLLCSVVEEWPDVDVHPTECNGVVEADHMGDRGLGQKADDKTSAPLCTQHHRERTDHTGSFRTLTKEESREWRARAIRRTQVRWIEQSGGEVTW